MILIRQLNYGILLTAALASPIAKAENPSPGQAVSVQGRQLIEAVAESNASSEAVVALAVERFALNHKQGLKWIMTMQDAEVTVRKFSDGQFTVVALPQDAAGTNAGLSRFVHAYNHMAIRAADVALQAGSANDSAMIYRLILRHAPSCAYSNALHARLEIVQELTTNANPSLLYNKIKNLEPQYDILSFVEDMGVQPPILVTNLLQIDVNVPESRGSQIKRESNAVSPKR